MNKEKKTGTEILQLKITLMYTDPPVWRRILIPGLATLEELHCAVQHSMGWDFSHLYSFAVRGRSSPATDPFGIDPAEECDMLLDEAFPRVRSKVRYTYDFGDDWLHEIVIEKRLPADRDVVYPVCTGGELACPPEDCGGVPGYYDIIHALRHGGDRRQRELLEWAGDFDPEAFSVDEANWRLGAARPRRKRTSRKNVN